MDIRQRYADASLKTAHELSAVAHSSLISDLSHLTLPEIDAAVDLVARLVPAGNVPGMILSGLANLAGRRPPLETIRRDIGLLFQGVEQMVDRAVYGVFFAGPAAVIWAYQQLLRLAGKDPADSFPDGTWQFYVQYALREDTARHANETHGFDTLLREHGITLSPVDRITAWVMTAVHCLHQYDQLLENEWRERVYTQLLGETAGAEPGAQLYRAWERQRPYGRGTDVAPTENYPAYRRRKFDQFVASAARTLSPTARQEWTRRVQAAEAQDLPAYRQQVSILAYLEPGRYSEERVPIPLENAHVGMIWQSNYYLLPACVPGTDLVAELDALAANPETRQDTAAALASLDRSLDANPAILIPVDASQRSPRDRLYPLCFEVPLRDLDLLTLHAQTVAALDAYEQAEGDSTVSYAEFDQLQRTYLAALAGFGAVMSRAKEIAVQGETTSVGAIRLLAHMPPAWQRLLDGIPSRFEVLNDVIRGSEVFSNVGAVAPDSTLVRFSTAIDDNEGKELAWGVVTDATGALHLSLRDFRPHVAPLIAAGQTWPGASPRTTWTATPMG